MSGMTWKGPCQRESDDSGGCTAYDVVATLEALAGRVGAVEERAQRLHEGLSKSRTIPDGGDRTSDDNVYGVHLHAYGDYVLAQVFTTRPAADALADLLNSVDDAFATVAVYPKRDDSFVLSWWLELTTVVHSDGTCDETQERRHPDAVAHHVGVIREDVSVTAPGAWTVITHGDASLVPQAHADAIAKLLAEADGS